MNSAGRHAGGAVHHFSRSAQIESSEGENVPNTNTNDGL